MSNHMQSYHCQRGVAYSGVVISITIDVKSTSLTPGDWNEVCLAELDRVLDELQPAIDRLVDASPRGQTDANDLTVSSTHEDDSTTFNSATTQVDAKISVTIDRQVDRAGLLAAIATALAELTELPARIDAKLEAQEAFFGRIFDTKVPSVSSFGAVPLASRIRAWLGLGSDERI